MVQRWWEEKSPRHVPGLVQARMRHDQLAAGALAAEGGKAGVPPFHGIVW